MKPETHIIKNIGGENVSEKRNDYFLQRGFTAEFRAAEAKRHSNSPLFTPQSAQNTSFCLVLPCKA